MSIETTDVKYAKSATVTDTGANGGRSSASAVTEWGLNNLFPMVAAAERAAGITRWRKAFWQNRSAVTPAEIAYLVTAFLTNQSNAGDRYYLAKGAARDTQATISAGNPTLVGCGKLSTALSGGETTVSAEFEGTESGFVPGGLLYISNYYKASQTIAADVKPGDSVQFITDTWTRIAYTDDINYPKGRYLGNDEVETVDTGSYEFRRLPTGLTENEVIGAGNGSSQTPTLSTLANITNGVNPFDDYRPVISVTVSGTAQTVTVNADGSCSGYCSAGQLNMSTGAWTTPITFTQPPDNSTDITCTYYDKFWSWSGSVCTVTLAEQVANPYLTANTYIAACLPELAEAVATYDTFTDADNLYDDTTYPLTCLNKGCVEDDWTITFTSSTAFICAGLFSGSVGTGNISTGFSPVNPSTGTPYFTLLNTGWMGSPVTGKQITFKTHVGEYPIWAKQIVPASTSAAPVNHVGICVISQ